MLITLFQNFRKNKKGYVIKIMRQLRARKSPKEFHPEYGTGVCNPKNKIIAVDFDGMLVHNKYPFIENPNMPLIDFIKEHRNEYTWILWTCRSGIQLKMAIDYLYKEHGIVFDFVNENTTYQRELYGDTRKIFADYYVDDKNITPSDLFFTTLVEK